MVGCLVSCLEGICYIVYTRSFFVDSIRGHLDKKNIPLMDSCWAKWPL